MHSHDDTRRPDVVVYHSASDSGPQSSSSLTKLRATGHVVHTPDLYDGEAFSDRNAIRKSGAAREGHGFSRADTAAQSTRL